MVVSEKADIESRIRLSRLLALYGELLPSQQRLAASLHFDEDLSMAEIAESKGTTRQAVFDAIRMARKSLENYDRVLGLLSKGESAESSAAAEIAASTPATVQQVSPATREAALEILEEVRRKFLRGNIIYDTKGLRAKIDELEVLLSPNGVRTREDETDV